MTYVDFRIPIQVSEDDFPFCLTESIWNELKTPYEPDARLAQLTSGQRAVYSLHWVLSEVGNGGFDQCFFNSTGYLMPDAIDGALLFEATKWRDVLCEAAEIFGSPFPLDRVVRQQLLDQLSGKEKKRLRLLDDRLYALDAEPSTSFDAICRRYVDSNPHDFFLPDPPPELVAQALLDRARRRIDAPPWGRNVDLAEKFLLQARQIARNNQLEAISGLVESLLSQIPFLRT